ncbi:MAG: N-acetylmuramoyl-L-alanine amidase [Ruminococcaceae bacterium]|nr:N-acetylmuramoyl-L-alanine amidase [Oscillospiraceae bacterium]
MKAVIGIDAGHGGSSSGTYSMNTVRDGLFEKDFALEQALLVEKHLLKNGFGVVMTRRSDKNPGNVSERAKICAEKNCDFALSIHFNGFGTESANGTEVFVPYPEKLAGIEAGFYEILGKYFKIRAPFARSNNYYNRNEIFDKRLNLGKRRFDAFSGEKDYFGFVRNCWEKGISADLLEICFITNPEDFKTYLENREKIAAGIAKSIVEAFGEEFVFGEEKEKIAAKPRIRRKFDVIN